jgi:hypothetical protein
MPVAVAVRNALAAAGSAPIRPTGRPMKMVSPAIAPRTRIWVWDTCWKGRPV